jgi:hypothetical protein
MKVTFTKHDGTVVEEECESYSVQSNPQNTVHELFLNPEKDAPEHRYRLRKVGPQEDGTRIGAPLYASAEFEDGNKYVVDVIAPVVEVSAEEADADGTLTDEEIEHMNNDTLATELESRGQEVPKLKADRVDALKAARLLPKT